MADDTKQENTPEPSLSLFDDANENGQAERNKKRSKRVAQSPSRKQASANADASAPSISIAKVRVGALLIHPVLAITAEDLEATEADRIDEIADQIRRRVKLGECPRVNALADGTFGALTHLDSVTAAMRVARKNPDLELEVIIEPAASGADLVVDALHTSRGRSGWEQYRMVSSDFGAGKVRERLRELELPIEKYESRISKVLKVGRLDPSILNAVNKLTIPVKEAGQIVDAWDDESKRDVMKQIIAGEQRQTNGLLDARMLFRAMLKALLPDKKPPVWRADGAGNQVLVAADGGELATLTIEGDRFRLEGTTLPSKLHRYLIEGLPSG